MRACTRGGRRGIIPLKVKQIWPLILAKYVFFLFIMLKRKLCNDTKIIWLCDEITTASVIGFDTSEIKTKKWKSLKCSVKVISVAWSIYDQYSVVNPEPSLQLQTYRSALWSKVSPKSKPVNPLKAWRWTHTKGNDMNIIAMVRNNM